MTLCAWCLAGSVERCRKPRPKIRITKSKKLLKLRGRNSCKLPPAPTVPPLGASRSRALALFAGRPRPRAGLAALARFASSQHLFVDLRIEFVQPRQRVRVGRGDVFRRNVRGNFQRVEWLVRREVFGESDDEARPEVESACGGSDRERWALSVERGGCKLLRGNLWRKGERGRLLLLRRWERWSGSRRLLGLHLGLEFFHYNFGVDLTLPPKANNFDDFVLLLCVMASKGSVKDGQQMWA